MTRERAKSMDQSSFWTVDAARVPGKPHRPLMASPEPGRLLAFAPFLGFIWRMSAHMRVSCVFHPGCPIAVERCAAAVPQLRELKPGHRAACWHSDRLMGRADG